MLKPGLQAFIRNMVKAKDAFVTVNGEKVGRRPISRYARENHMEYWAETVAAYEYHREALRQYDPFGHALVERVFREAGVQP